MGAAGLLVLALAGCGLPAGRGSPSPGTDARRGAEGDFAREGAAMVAGHWRGDGDRVEFFPGGTVLLYRWPGRVAGSFAFVEPGRMLLEFRGTALGSIPGDYRVRREGDVLVLCETDRPDRCLRYVRAPRPAPARTDGRREAPPRLAPTPDLATAPPESLEREAIAVLRMAHTLQQTFFAEHGRFASSFEELGSVGWEPPEGLRWYHPPTLESAAPGELCMQMMPVVPELWPVYVDEGGRTGRGRC